ncbi:uncharacterized protein BDR25DRAFT_344207 [Lindgomyces ingoldianus]|uniref:Uncharacterized protein n=1 Tax=Lindgomyces ingoldianus TaxID=673940 RepID=A0ACB6QND9_9PLEO|nr:uncharacterized protein BDR25DRAFT_344207 [Lindgomyces ingoldianus]KAF2468468.1 hypothetical protein BDR25DRAFT_344207 [Lindgomyces ingoldianus]
MHFLCLHGIGTNSQVLEMQLTTLRYALGDDHTYDFVEGQVPWPMAEEIRAFVSPGAAACYAFFDPFSAASARAALDDLAEYIASEGPFDGVIGFSHGSCLASTLLLQTKLQEPDLDPVFKCALFFSAGAPLDPSALSHGVVRHYGKGGEVLSGFMNDKLEHHLEHQEGQERDSGCLIDFPTVHVWDEEDACAPGQARRLLNLCDPQLREEVIHSEGHSVPGGGPRSKEVLDRVVVAFKDMIARAEAQKRNVAQ